MPVNPIPDGYHTATPYLVVNDVDGLVEFLQKGFNAELAERLLRKDGSVAHAEVRIGDSMIMIGGASAAAEPTQGMIYLYVSDTDTAYQRALQAGASSQMEPADQYYGDRNAGVKDPFGNIWWLATHVEDVPPDELQRRALAASSGSG